MPTKATETGEREKNERDVDDPRKSLFHVLSYEDPSLARHGPPRQICQIRLLSWEDGDQVSCLADSEGTMLLFKGSGIREGRRDGCLVL